MTTYITSIQTVEITVGTSATSATATINAVATANAVVFFGGFTTDNTGTTRREFMPRVELTNATTVTVYRDTASASFGVTVRATVVEFDPGIITSVQAGTITVAASATSGTATIGSVTTSTSALFYLGGTATTTTTASTVVDCRLSLTNATTVTATRNTSGLAVLTVGYAVVQFAAGVINSIQPKSKTLTTGTLSDTDTITAVNTANAMVLYNGATGGSVTYTIYYYDLRLTNSTTVTLTRTDTGSTTRTINYTVVEFVSGVLNSVQRNTTAVASATSADATITSVNTSLAVCNALNFAPGTTTTAEAYASVKLLNGTTVRSQKNTAGSSTSTTGWEVIEFTAPAATVLPWPGRRLTYRRI